MEPKHFCMTLPRDLVEKLRIVARERSVKDQKDYSFQDLVREAVFEKYPRNERGKLKW